MNNKNINNKVEPSLESLSKNFTFNNIGVLHHTGFKIIMSFQQKDKSLIEIAKEWPKNCFIKEIHGAGKVYYLICRYGEIVIPNQS